MAATNANAGLAAVATKEPTEQLRDELDELMPDLETTTQFKKWCQDVGLEQLGAGCFRFTYSFGPGSNLTIPDPEKYVLKIDYTHSACGNRTEVEAESVLPDDFVEDFFVPISMVGNEYRWLIMERADTTNLDYEEADELCDTFEGLGWKHCDVGPGNLGRHDGRIKMVDYGHRWERISDETYVVEIQ